MPPPANTRATGLSSQPQGVSRVPEDMKETEDDSKRVVHAGPEYGGSPGRLAWLREGAQADVEASGQAMNEDLARLDEDYARARANEAAQAGLFGDQYAQQQAARGTYEGAIAGLPVGAQQGVGMRNAALAGNDINRAARDAGSIRDSYLARTDLEGTARNLADSRTAALERTNLMQEAYLANIDRSGALGNLEGAAADANRLGDTYLDRTNLEQAAADANARRDEALRVGDLNTSAGEAIGRNAALSRERVDQALGQQARQAMGLATGQGEGGALAMQQAIASSGQAAADLLARSETEQAQLASDMRYGAARDQVGRQDAFADAAAQTQFQGAAQQAANTLTVGGQAAQRAYEGAQQQAANRIGIADANAQSQLAAAAQQAARQDAVADANASSRMSAAAQQAANTLNVANANASERVAAAGQQASNAITVGDANARAVQDAAANQAQLYGDLYGQSRAGADSAFGREQAYNATGNQIAQQGASMQLSREQAALQNQQFIEGTQLGIDQATAAAGLQEKTAPAWAQALTKTTDPLNLFNSQEITNDAYNSKTGQVIR